MGKRNRDKKPKQKAGRPSKERPERQQDPRLRAVMVGAIDGQPLPPGHWAVAVEPVLMDDGRELQWLPPVPVAFSLVEAKRLSDRGVPRRKSVVGNLRRRDNGTYGPTNPQRALDVVADLWSAVLHSAAAIESIANESIDQLPDDAVVEIGKKDRTEQITKPDMVRRLNLAEKLSKAIPMLDTGEQIKGTHAWEQYLRIVDIRDALVHVKDRGIDTDPEIRTAYDRLLLGEADTCAKDSFDVVQAARPGFLPGHVVTYLSS